MKYILLIFALLAVTGELFSQKKEHFRLKTVVIDAGHGGTDPGACYGKLYEKDIVLDIAKRFGGKIKKSFPSVKVVYTRSTDKFLTLKERGAIANKAKGDIFISIHANATEGKTTKATGTETYTMGIHKSKESLAVAQKENSVITFESGYEKSYEGFNPKEPESYIMFSLGQYGFSESSMLLASFVEKGYLAQKRMPSRGVKQAGFLVLWYPSMPSILTEVGFLNNSKDRAVLSTAAGRERLATGLFNAFKEYKEEVEVVSHYTSESSDEPTANFTPYSKSATGYGIQLVTSSKRLAITPEVFGFHYNNVFEVASGGKYRYVCGVVSSQSEASRLQSEIRRGKNFKDCFMVGINSGVLVKASDVRRIINK